MKETSPEELVEACIRGEKSAWDEFIERYAKLIYNYIYNILKIKGSSFEEEKVEDIFQGICLHLLSDNCRRLKSFQAKNKCKFSTWLRTVTINYTLDFLRKEKPCISLDEQLEADYSLSQRLADLRSSPSEIMLHKDRLLRLAQKIKELDLEDRYFLELHIYRNMSLEKISGILKVSRASLDMRKRRIILKLREEFSKEGVFSSV